MKDIKLEFSVSGDWTTGVDTVVQTVERFEEALKKKYGGREPHVEVKFLQLPLTQCNDRNNQGGNSSY